MAYVYGLRCECGCEAGGVRYVGQTVLPLPTRLTNHRSQSRFGTQTPVYHWMRKHGENNIRIELLEITSPGTLDEREIWWIANTPNLLNVSTGGAVSDWLRGGKRPDVSKRMQGSAHYGTRLSEEDVVSIRAGYTGARGEVSRLAKEHGLSVASMSDLLRGISWRHVPLPAKSQGKSRVRLTEEDVRKIRVRRGVGETLGRIAADYGTSETNISHICNRTTWKHVV